MRSIVIKLYLDGPARVATFQIVLSSYQLVPVTMTVRDVLFLLFDCIIGIFAVVFFTKKRVFNQKKIS